MGKKTPKPPAPIDYAAAATAQGEANKTASLLGSYLSNPNVTNPYGSSRTTWGVALDSNGKPILDEKGNPQVQANVVQTLQGAGYTDASGNKIASTGAALAEENRQKVEAQLSGLASTGADVAAKSLSNPFQYGVNYTGPKLETEGPKGGAINYGPAADAYGLSGSINANDYRAAGINADDYGRAASINAGAYNAAGIDANAYGQAGGINAGAYGQAAGINAGDYGQAMGRLDLSNVARMPVNAGMTGQNAILSRLAPQIQQSEAATAQRLANQGITLGGEAYRNAMRNQGQQFNDLYTQAALQGINLDIGANQQGYGQALSSAGLYNQAINQNFAQGATAREMQNQAIAQNYGQGLSAQQLANQAIGQNFGQGLAAQQLANQAAGQNFGQGLSAQELANAAIGQNFGQGVTAQQLTNAAAAQNFGQGLSAQQLTNAAIDQNYGRAATSSGLQNAAQTLDYNQRLTSSRFGNESKANDLAMQLGLYNQPLNAVNALMASSQIQNPVFGAYSGSNVAAAPVFEGVRATGADANANYATRVGAYNAGMGAIGAIGGAATTAAAAAASDIRLKSKIVRVGTHPLGIGIYEYDIDGRRERGVIAQEVERVLPSAVIEHPDGYKMVDYGAL